MKIESKNDNILTCSISNADGFARVTGPCGDTIEICLNVSDDIIQDVSFNTDGCSYTIACAYIVTEIIKGIHITEAFKVDQDKIITEIGDLPEDHKHCALLASNTLKKALTDYVKMKNEPWRKAYRR